MMNFIGLIMITLGVIFFISIITIIVRRYKRCPSDKLLVIYGRTGKNVDGEISTARVTHGGGAFIWPVVQDYSYLDLTPIPIDIQLKSALSRQNIRIDVPSTFTVAISTERGVMQNAAERLLGLDRKAIAQLAQDIIFGQLRLVVATMDIEQINADRDVFLDNIQKAVEPEISKIGLKLINVNITDINDESGYIKALGQEAAAKAINEAKVSVAEKNRDGEVGHTEAERDQRIKVAQANSLAQIGEADANQEMRAKTASADAKAIAGENTAAINVANTTAERRVAEAEANRIALTAKNVKEAEALKDTYIAQEISEKQRAEKDRATQYASIVVPQEIDKLRIEIEADAKAAQIKKVAQGEADATYAKMEAQARGLKEILTKQAEGFKQIVDATGSADNALKMIIADKLPELVRIQVDAIKNIKIDKITVWDSGNGNDDGNSTSNFLQNMLKVVPPLTDAFSLVGAELPVVLQGAGTRKRAENHVNNDMENNKEMI